MNDDMALLQEFAARHSEQAFETLVSRYVHLVHSAALRQVGDAHRAEDITQTVFIILARKAGTLSPKTILAGWLYRTTHFACSAALKIQLRRERREREAHMETLIHETQSESAWEHLSPLLDEAMSKLRESDRDALVLRFFQNKSLREVGAALGVEEHAAQKRVQRALEKLREIFAKRGAVSTAAAIAKDLSANSVQPAPVLLAKSIVAIAAVKGASVGGSTLTIIQGTLKLMAWTKAKTAAVAGAAIILAIATTTTTTLVIRHAREPKPIVPAEAGYATPEATCRTMVWAATHGDVKMFVATLSPAVQKQFLEVHMKGKSEPEISEFLQRKAEKMGNISVVAQRPGPGGSSVLQLRFRKEGNYTVDWMKMSNVNGEWKIDNL